VTVAPLFFNVGVEICQVTFIAAVLALIALARRVPIDLPACCGACRPAQSVRSRRSG
jgi:hypothetical protein